MNADQVVAEAIEVGASLTGERVAGVLERLKRITGTPARTAVDTGPEFDSKAPDAWAYRNGMHLAFSRPGKPTDNAFAESFNGHFRAESLDCHGFAELPEARRTIEAWRLEDNTERPHRVLGQESPEAWMTARECHLEAVG